MTGEVVLSPKLIERRRSVRREHRRRRRRIAVLVLVVLAGSSSAFALTRSRFFAVEDVVVRGARLVPARAIVDASGIAVGDNALSLDLAAAERSVRSVTGVADVSVAREGLAVVITVTERKPALVVRGYGAPYIVDRDAVVLDVPLPEARGLPVLVLPPTITAEARVVAPALTPEIAGGITRLYQQVPAAMRDRIDAFRLVGGVLEFDAGPTRVVFGELADIDRKMAGWRMVRRRVAADGDTLDEIDLRAPGRPSARIS